MTTQTLPFLFLLVLFLRVLAFTFSPRMYASHGVFGPLHSAQAGVRSRDRATRAFSRRHSQRYAVVSYRIDHISLFRDSIFGEPSKVKIDKLSFGRGSKQKLQDCLGFILRLSPYVSL